ncbi:uncharacterized protein C5L36_0B04620 [Pichia kudriavzevii]|uniref:Ubiquitination network signaling protein acrB n=1 Tax=Pichia kudriavzevii TaxID=4909 RepID=A0A2U9R1S4_PICKU|nr:uncharacterized protein C5L36_0B04620 [Pichia kudriavzevii]AWU75211.1 hypothetical protein C5L36_0B04620 [Pichia kudriavzevii]
MSAPPEKGNTAPHKRNFSSGNNSNSGTNNILTDNNQHDKSHIHPNVSYESLARKMSKKTNRYIMSSLPSYPLLDTFSLLCILVIFPHWLSAIIMILYVFLGHPDFLEIILAIFLKHRLNRNSPTHLAPRAQRAKTFSFLQLVIYLVFDASIMAMMFLFTPYTVPYIILLAKSFLASNLISLRNRYILDAFISCSLLILLESTSLYIIRHFEIFRGDSLLSLTSDYSSAEILYPLYYSSPASVTKTLIYYLSFNRFGQNSAFMFRMEYAVQFLHSTFSLYIILHNLNPIFRKVQLVDKLICLIQDYIISAPNDDIDLSYSTNEKSHLFQSSSMSKGQNVFIIPKEISCAPLPTLRSHIMTVDESEDENARTLDEVINSKLKQDIDEGIQSDAVYGVNVGDNIENRESNTETGIPMHFPEDHQVLNLNDVSSPGYVVAQNFENFCRMIWSSTSNLLYISRTPSLKVNDFTTNSTNNATNSVGINKKTLSHKRSFGKLKNNTNIPPSSNVEKRVKVNLLKYQQPLWTFFNAMRAMFSRYDIYSGDYYSQNAMVTTGNGAEDYARSINSSSQCFIWFTGETTLVFELHNISLEQLLIKVNGIIWEHVSSCAFFGREMIIINGLSPLSQYDIDFVKITLKGELVHLTTTTVSTVFQNKIVTESTSSSPLSTLQRSVVTTQEAIEREKARLKKLKSDWKKKAAQLKADIENLNSRNKPSDESRNYKKLDSLRQAITKSDTEAALLSKEGERVRLLQTELEENFMEAKRHHEVVLRLYNKAQNDAKVEVSKIESKISASRAEKNQLLIKKEKIISKKLRIHHDVELLNNELESLRKTEIALRVERRKIRSIQREEKYNLLVKDIETVLNSLKMKALNDFGV